MSKIVTKTDLQAAFDKQAWQLTLRFGAMVAVGVGLIPLELVIVALVAS